jgi:hypothetical protein
MQTAVVENQNELSIYRPGEAGSCLAGSIEGPLPLRFWEIESFFKCPVIGICLDINEQKQILKKTGISFKNMTPFEIHEILVGKSEDKNHISRKVECRLNQKFKKEIAEFFHLEEDEFIHLWKICVEDGKIEGIFWVAAIRPDLSKEARMVVFGDIHMEMHLSSGRNRKVRQRLAHQQEENSRLAHRLKQITSIWRDLKKANKKMEKDLSELHKTCVLLENTNQELEQELSELRENSLIASLQAEKQQLKADQSKSQGDIKLNQQRIFTLQDQNAQLLSKLEKQRDLNSHFRGEMERATAQILALDRCDETCPAFDLCQKRILIVGGITKIEALYRQIVEENGGIFDYHDGYMKGGIKTLETRVKRADMVLCPTNCNSHTACLVVKKLGKKHRTPVRMLASSSLNSISQTLLEHHKHISIQ